MAEERRAQVLEMFRDSADRLRELADLIVRKA
jgi:hypothetical protein